MHISLAICRALNFFRISVYLKIKHFPLAK